MLSLLLATGAAATAAPAAGTTKIRTEAERVTLFIDGAQITRTKRIDLQAGAATLLFTGLSPHLDDKSLQVRAKGPVTITSVNRLFNPADSIARTARRRQAEEEAARLERESKRLKASREVAEAEIELLKTNCSTVNRTAGTPLQAIRELNEYYAARLRALKEELLDIDARTETLAGQIGRLRQELAQAGGRKSDPLSEIEVRIEVPAACKAEFTLVYYVRNAGWFPSYDIRSEGLDAPLEIDYKANLFQNTGEEWKNVALTLSSSDPRTGNIAPQLKTYWLDYGLTAPRYDNARTNNTVSGTVFDEHREPLVGATVRIPGTTVGTATDTEGHYSLTVPPGSASLAFSYIGYESRTCPVTGERLNVALRPDRTALDEVVVTAYGTSKQLEGRLAGIQVRNAEASAGQAFDVSSDAEEESIRMEVAATQNRLGYEFEIRQPYTVASDGKTVVAQIGRYRLPAVYSYRCTPKIDKDAFLSAEAAGWERLNLMEGEANVFFENTFVGKSILDPSQTDDTLRFSLGRDSGLRIEREKLHDYTSRKVIGTNRTQTVAWKITVRNTRAETAALTLCDQIPVSRNSTITVTEEELSGGELNRENGTVTWNLRLAPGEQRVLVLRYHVKSPKGRYLAVE